jgi:hypothetical protein
MKSKSPAVLRVFLQCLDCADGMAVLDEGRVAALEASLVFEVALAGLLRFAEVSEL